MSGKVYRYSGRDFTEAEIQWIRDCARRGDMNRNGISKAFCEHVGWYKPDGGLKDMSARVAMLRMHRDGLIDLPSRRNGCGAGKIIPIGPIAQTDPPAGIIKVPESLGDVRPLEFQVAETKQYRRIWRSYIERYHYIGYKPLAGAQISYIVRSGKDGEPVAALGFGAAAWKTAPRDRFIGWSKQQRVRNLPLVINNARFLILPWIRMKNLASHILGECEKRIGDDWEKRYALRPVLLETFCEIPRFSGTCYKAANWVCVGQTKGRGKLDRYNQYSLPVKDIWLKPLQKNWKSVLIS